MSGTALAAVQAYLLTAITNQVNDTTVQVFYDLPIPGGQLDDLIGVGCDDKDAANEGETVQTAALVGNGGDGRYFEQFTIPVGVFVYRGGDDFRTTKERTVTLVNAVLAAVRADLSLGATVNVEANPTDVAYRSYWADNHAGTCCDASVRITCTNLI